MFCSGVFGGKLNLYIPHLQNPSNLQGRLLQIPNDNYQKRRLPKVSNNADSKNALPEKKTAQSQQQRRQHKCIKDATRRAARRIMESKWIHSFTYVPIPSLRPKAYGTDEPNQSWIPSLGDGGRGKLAPPSHTKKNRLPKKGEGNMVATTFAIQFH